MTEIEKLKSIFHNDVNCLKFLFINNQIESCDSCGKTEFYRGADFTESFVKVCKSCKKKINPKKNTLFENVQFGLVTTFHIYIEATDTPEHKASYAPESLYTILSYS